VPALAPKEFSQLTHCTPSTGILAAGPRVLDIFSNFAPRPPPRVSAWVALIDSRPQRVPRRSTSRHAPLAGRTMRPPAITRMEGGVCSEGLESR
jgi:hypothetical protein